MNRAISRRAVPIIHTLKLPKKAFNSGAFGGGTSSVQQDQHKHVNIEKLDVTNNLDHYDIAIVGGGMVGMAFACALSNKALTKQLRVAIVDSNPALGVRNSDKNKDLPPDARVSTVTPASISFFKELGAWQYVEQHRHAFFSKMQVWDYTGLGYTRYNARDVGKDILGCVVENKVLHRSLFSCLQDTDFQTTIHPARLTSMVLESHSPSADIGFQPSNMKGAQSGTTLYSDSQQRIHGSLAKLELSNGSNLYTKLVIGADGARSKVREIAGLTTTGWNYSQNAVICTVEHTVENHCAWQRFLPAGPIALLPMGDRYSNIVWTMSPKEASDHKSMTEDDFVKAVNHALDFGYGPHPQSSFLGQYGDRFSWLMGGMTPSANEHFEVPPKVIRLASERMSFPLSLMHARDYAARRVVLIGDAAHTVHPLAGQGVNLGFDDAFTLSKVIEEGIMLGTDIGELSLLKKYERERKLANIMMMAVLDGFQKAFSVDMGPINLLRAAAFHGAQYLGPLKKSIISYATGEQKWPLFT